MKLDPGSFTSCYSGALKDTNAPFCLALLSSLHIAPVMKLHDHVIDCLPPEEKSFILPRSKTYFSGHLDKGDGNIILGAALEDGTLVGKAVIMHPPAGSFPADMGGALLTSPPEKTSILQAVTVHPDWRGKGLMPAMTNYWLRHAHSHMRSYVLAEIEINNETSWRNFLKAGLNIVAMGESPVDGAQVYNAQTRIKYALLKELKAPGNEGAEHARCPAKDISAQKSLFARGYMITGTDAVSGEMILKKKT